ncbi:calcium-binding protein [Oceaniglobus indicus]|uniref:calcium-binding protein n=1 Tax=Oceaniglobus indicus TaxID=2047749 RepID=UPI000C17D726|nr:calcium-binding protein [Oceaniglobus indicus]
MDPLFLGNIAALIGLLSASFLDFGSLLGDDDESADDTPPDNAQPTIVPLDFPGTEGADSFTSVSDADARYDLLGGDDSVAAGFGDDTINAGAGDDSVQARVGDDLVTLGDGNDTAAGGFGDDTLAGDAGNDSILGDSGRDSISGGYGDDTLEGGDDDDTLNGDAGDDLLYGGAGADLLRGGAGDDTLNGLYDDTTLSRTVDPDLADTLEGGDGDDRLILGAADTATGGTGNDQFVLDDAIGQPDADADADTAGPAVITDFDADDDMLVLEYDGDTMPELTIEMTAATDTTQAAAVILANGQAVAQLPGIEDLTLAQIELVRV